MRLVFLLPALFSAWVGCADREKPMAPREPSAKINPGLTASAHPVAAVPDGRYAPLNRNNVLLPVQAHSELFGSWYVDVSEDAGFPADITFTFEADSTLRVQFFFDFSDVGFWEAVLRFGPEDEELPEIPSLDILQVHGLGTYRVEEDVIYPHIEHSEMWINGEDPYNYFIDLAVVLAEFAADQEGIPDEEREKYVDDFIEGFLTDYADDFTEEDYFEELNEEAFTFEVDGYMLTMTDSYGDTLIYERVPEEDSEPPAGKPVAAPGGRGARPTWISFALPAGAAR